MRIAHRHADIRVSQQRLYTFERDPFRHQLRRKAMPQIVQSDLRNPGRSNAGPEWMLHAGAVQVAAVFLGEDELAPQVPVGLLSGT